MQSFDVCDAINDRVLIMGPEGTIVIPYEWGLAGPGGAWFRLHPAKDVPESYVAEAENCIRQNRDVVSLRIVR